MDANPQEFYNRTVGKAYDVDGAYGFQCWDLWAECCRSNGVPLSVIHCSLTGYVEDTWKLRHKSGILDYFDAVPAESATGSSGARTTHSLRRAMSQWHG